MAKVVGDELMTRYVIAFETAGLLLTVALVGAIAIAHREEAEPAPRTRSPRPRGEPASAAGARVAAGCGRSLRRHRRRPGSLISRPWCARRSGDRAWSTIEELV